MDIIFGSRIIHISSDSFEKKDKFIDAFLQKKLIPMILGGFLGAQFLPNIRHEVEYQSRPFDQLVVEHQNGEQDHSQPEPEELPYLVAVDTSNTVSGDTVSTVLPHAWRYTYKLQENNLEKPTSASDSF